MALSTKLGVELFPFVSRAPLPLAYALNTVCSSNDERRSCMGISSAAYMVRSYWLWIKLLARFFLKRCRLMIFCSRVSRSTRRYTLTVRFWPILCARSMACRSFMGFQSCSKKMTVSAPVRLRPRPPTAVVMIMILIEASLLNSSTCSNLSWPEWLDYRVVYLMPYGIST